MNMKNLNKYIGIPFVDLGRTLNGVDCWGLVYQFYKQEKGILLPEIKSYESTTDSVSIADQVNLHRDKWIKTNQPEIGDVILFNILGKPIHVGIFLDREKFLHTTQGINSCIESLRSHMWANRIEGFYRYA